MLGTDRSETLVGGPGRRRTSGDHGAVRLSPANSGRDQWRVSDRGETQTRLPLHGALRDHPCRYEARRQVARRSNSGVPTAAVHRRQRARSYRQMLGPVGIYDIEEWKMTRKKNT